MQQHQTGGGGGASLPSRQELLEHLLAIFTHHARHGDRLSGEKLGSVNFCRMLEQAGLGLDRRAMDVLFSKINGQKSHLNFDAFLAGIPEIANCLDPVPRARSPSPQRVRSPTRFTRPADLPAISRLMKDYFIPHSESLVKELDGRRWLHLKPPPDLELKHAETMIAAVEHGLLDVYSGYFPWELKGGETQYDELRVQSLKKLFLFINDFDLCPILTNKTLAFSMWHSAMHNPPEVPTKHKVGVAFTFPKFLEFVLKCAHIGFHRESEMTLPERLNAMLSNMQLSKGLVIVESRKTYPHSMKAFLVPPKALFQQIISDLLVSQGHSKPKKLLKRSDSRHSPLRQHTLEAESLSREMADDIAASGVFLKHAKPLQMLFESYCAYGEPLNPHSLKSSKFMKLMRDAKIVKPLEPGSPELMYRSRTQVETPPPFDRSISPILSKQFSAGFSSPRKLRKKLDESMSVLEGPYLMTNTDCDLLFSKLTGRPQPRARFDSPSRFGSDKGRMEYPLFLKAVEFIARDLSKNASKDFKEALVEVIENFLLPLYFSTLSPVKSEGGGLQRSNSPERHFRIDEIQSLRELLHSDKKAFKLLGRTLVPLFAAYALPNSMSMDFDGFARDFEIFPDVLPKSRIMLFFHTLARHDGGSSSSLLQQHSISFIHQSSSLSLVSEASSVSSPKRGKHRGLLDEALFTEAIGMCAIEGKTLEEENVSTAQKIVFLLERMSQSRGPGVVMRLSGQTRITPLMHKNKVFSCPNPHHLTYLFREEMPKLFPKAPPPVPKTRWLEDLFKI